ncbi:barwin-like endoglucanase [Thozetella sp. PMI_491]|nr:barwin-like endoglucanase [Thozetella sp. PMI_491]
MLDPKITGAASNACFGRGGVAYSCNTYQPIVVNSSFSYVFAGNWETSNCCKCFHVTWTTGTGKGKSMIVQVVNAFGVDTGDFDLYTPGGGVGGLEACQSQYGAPRQGWDAQYGGVQTLAQCSQLPASLQDGCKWRFNWAGGTVNGWKTTYEQVTCPKVMTDISGCSA